MTTQNIIDAWESGVEPYNATTFQVVMTSDEYGGEDFKYDSLIEAYEGIARLATAAAKLNDGIRRNFYLNPFPTS